MKTVLIRALIRPQGTVGPMVTRLRRGDYTKALSEPLCDELLEIANLPRIRERYHLDREAIQAFVAELAERGEVVNATRRIEVCRDAEDNRVLEAALAGEADYVVTGDQDLLVLDPFEGIRIVTSRASLEV